ncbi:hypothetical protein GY45DRAFT_6539 [Cubamyces sp. BRFM 1775]|nr:hypothetical protein GY45DRAFT_6539 [Cubamyces sp. BRFM 1775]
MRQKNVCDSCKIHYSTGIAPLLHYQTSTHGPENMQAMVEASQVSDAARRPSAVLTTESQAVVETISFQPTASTPPSVSHFSPYPQSVNPPQLQRVVADG